MTITKITLGQNEPFRRYLNDMDLRIVKTSTKLLPDITLCVVKGWDPGMSDLYDAILPYVGDSAAVFIDGNIGSGKSTFHEYFEKRFTPSDGLVSFPEPIDDILKVLKPYLNGTMTLEDTNERISASCRDPWLNYLKKLNNTDPCNSSRKLVLTTEHLPPPFHTWIFEKDIRARFDQEVEERQKELEQSRESMVLGFTREGMIERTLNKIPELRQFKKIVVIIFNPSVGILMEQIADRDRSVESVYSIAFIRYLSSKFRRAIWEITDKPHLSKGDIDRKIESLIAKYP